MTCLKISLLKLTKFIIKSSAANLDYSGGLLFSYRCLSSIMFAVTSCKTLSNKQLSTQQGLRNSLSKFDFTYIKAKIFSKSHPFHPSAIAGIEDSVSQIRGDRTPVILNLIQDLRQEPLAKKGRFANGTQNLAKPLAKQG